MDRLATEIQMGVWLARDRVATEMPLVEEMFAFDGPCINDRVSDIRITNSKDEGDSYPVLLDQSFTHQDNSDGNCVTVTDSDFIHIDLGQLYSV